MKILNDRQGKEIRFKFEREKNAFLTTFSRKKGEKYLLKMNKNYIY